MWHNIRRMIRLQTNFHRTYSTIYALSSGQGKCGVAVVRISGRHAKEVILRMTSCTLLPKPRYALLTPVFDPEEQNQLDKGLVLWFPGPKSFTGEDCCELQIHGGPAVVSAVLKALSKLPNFRPAQPGEFTKRAFFAGKMDLTEVEGLSDLIHAETEQQRRQALLQMEGNLGMLYKSWRDILLKGIAHVEAYIDFSEEENIEENVLQLTIERLSSLSKSITKHLEDSRRGERLRNGVRTVIVGQPNVGKSSLLNYIVRRPAAIVTPIAGTTRDVVEINVDIAGFPLLVADTAGLRDNSTDEVENEGIRRARSWAESADLALLIFDAKKIKPGISWKNIVNSELKDLNINIKHGLEVLPVINKIDLLSQNQKEELFQSVKDSASCISCTTELGMPIFLKHLGQKLSALCGEPSRESPSITQERHRFCLTQCLESLNTGLSLFNDTDILLAADWLGKSQRHLGLITGHVTTDDVLDVIFRDFCVGK